MYSTTASSVSPLVAQSRISHGTAVTELRDMTRSDVMNLAKSEVMAMLAALHSKRGANTFKEVTVKGWLKDRLSARERSHVFANTL